MLSIGDCSHANSVIYDTVVTDGYKSQGARLHILATPGLSTTTIGSGCLISYASHILRPPLRSTLQDGTLNINATAQCGDSLRAAIAHIDNKLPSMKAPCGKVLPAHEWESKIAAPMKHMWFTDCDSTSSSLRNTATPSGQNQRLNIEIKARRAQLWRTEDGEIIDPRVTEKRLERTSDRCLWVDTAAMSADPLTKTDVPKDIRERLARLLEYNEMDLLRHSS